MKARSDLMIAIQEAVAGWKLTQTEAAIDSRAIGVFRDEDNKSDQFPLKRQSLRRSIQQ